MHYVLLPLFPNRVRRNYLGGAVIDRLQSGNDTGIYRDGDRPEEWVASLVSAQNPGLAPVEDEGLSRCAVHGQPLLRDLLQASPQWYLGRDDNVDLGFLLKILDSSMRLHVQAHPTAAFAQEFLGSKYGKFECYYILSIRDGSEGYIRLGFQHPPSRSEWRRIIVEQDIPAMDACFEKIPVRPGEVWIIPGGVPHAIGENTLMLEIMEPSDLVVRCEFEREGIIVPPQARFMGRDVDFCLDIFDYTPLSPACVNEKFRLSPRTITAGNKGVVYEELAAPPAAPFNVRRLSLEPGAAFRLDGGLCYVAIVTRGKACITAGGETTVVHQGQSLCIAAAAEHTDIHTQEQTELCFVTS